MTPPLYIQSQSGLLNTLQIITQLYAGDAQRPDVHLAVVLPLVHGQDHLRSHPEQQRTPQTSTQTSSRVTLQIKGFKLRGRGSVLTSMVFLQMS